MSNSNATPRAYPAIMAWVCLVAILCNMFGGAPVHAAMVGDNADTIERMAWGSVPRYLKTQINNMTLNCTQGTLTTDHVRVFAFHSPNHLDNYVFDFTAWAKQPLLDCAYGPRLCDGGACMLYAYSQIATGVFKQSLRTYVRGVKVTEVTEADLAGKEQIYPGFEYTQDKYQCRLVNGGSDTCAMDFTWKDGKFTYFGFGKSDDAAATTEQALPPDAPVTQ